MNHLNWIETLPESWEARPLRTASDYMVSNVDKITADNEIPVRLCNYSDVYHNEIINLGADFMRATATADEIEKFRLEVGDVLITKDSESWNDIGVPALVKETASDLVCGYHLALLRPRGTQLAGAFLFRCLQAHPIRLQLELAANGVTRFGLSKSAIGGIVLPIPPLSQQRTIADYLDRETARLDRLVAEKERVLRLLAERHRWVISRTVTQGLRPGKLTRDSGIPGLGPIPAHWRTVRLRFLISSIEQGWSPPTENREPSPDQWGVLKLNAVSQGHFDDTAAKTLRPDLTPRTHLTVHAGDFLVTRSNTPLLVGDACFVESTRPRLMLSDLIYRLNLCHELIDGRFLAYFLTLSVGRSQIEVDARGTSASMVKISQEHIKDWWIPVPPKAEQQAIVRHLATETARIDSARTATDRTVSLLKERRGAIVAATVAGQIEVEGAA